MPRKKPLKTSSEDIVNNPFASLDLSFAGAPLDDCKKSKDLKVEKEDFSGGVVKIRLEKKGRGGKSVTVFYGFEKDQKGLEHELLLQMKKFLATGGKLTDEGIELQGDMRQKSSEWLIAKGYKVKGQIS